MKTKILLSVAIIASVFGLTQLKQNTAHTSTSGGPAGYTGSISDGKTCGSNGGCHSGSSVIPQTGWITSNIPMAGYTPGQTYTVTLNATASGIMKFGFQVTAENAMGAKKGTFVITNTTQTQITGTNYVTHKAAGTSGSGSKSWSFNWTAPVAGTGAVTFYGVVNATNGNSGTSGDQIYTSTLAVNEFVQPTAADPVSGIMLADITNNGNGSDLQVSFNKATNENTIASYRIIVVKSADAAGYNLDSANAEMYYKSITPNGSNISSVLDNNSKDHNGDDIQNNVAYKIFVLSVADGSNATINTLSGPSSEITLMNSVGFADMNSEQVNIYSINKSIFIRDLIDNNGFVRVFNTAGQLVFSDEILGDNDMMISLDYLKDGIYIVSLQNGNSSINKKLLIK